MDYRIKELRKLIGLTQQDFAKRYSIPLSTLRKWEQGDSNPAAYFVILLAQTLPIMKDNIHRISGADGNMYFYDSVRSEVADATGNRITVNEDLNKINPQNLSIYIVDLFEGFRKARDKFKSDCMYDKKENIIWEKWE